jgi:hypothetical protein
LKWKDMSEEDKQVWNGKAYEAMMHTIDEK